MEKSKCLFACIAGAVLFSGATVHAQTNVLWLVTEGHAGVERNDALMTWINDQQPGAYNFTRSFDVDPTLTTDTADSISQSQMDTLNSYDMIVMGRYGVGSSSNVGSRDWNDVTSPMLVMNPFMPRDSRWGWQATSDMANRDIQDMVVQDPTSPLFAGVDTSGGTLQIHNAPLPTGTPLEDSSIFTGTVAGWTDVVDDQGNNLQYPWAVQWNGTEDAFYTGGSEAPGGRRTLFLQNINMDPNDWTADGQQVFLNSMAATVPEPSTYALWAGFGALGGALLLRRFRRKV